MFKDLDGIDIGDLSTDHTPENFDVMKDRQFTRRNPPVKFLCNCEEAAKLNGRKYKDDTYMYPTESTNKKTCNFCSHAIFKDYSNGQLKEAFKDSQRGPTVHRRFEKPRKPSTVSDWHKTSK